MIDPASVGPTEEVDTAVTEQLAAGMPFARVLGVTVSAASSDRVIARLRWAPERCTTGGVLHGAVLMGLADVSGGLCAFLNLPDGASGTTTIESKTNMFRAVRSGNATAEAKPLHRGRTTIVVETTVTDDSGRLVAKTTQTQAVLRNE